MVLRLLTAALLATPAPLDAAPEAATTRIVIVVEMRDRGASDFRFAPHAVKVRRGDTLRFVQRGVAPHNVQITGWPSGANPGSAVMGPFVLAKGATYELVIDERFPDGVYEYACTPHASFGMKGSFTVSGG